MLARPLVTLSLVLFFPAASASRCGAMADMARDVAQVRDTGVPLSAVEEQLRKDVRTPRELEFTLFVVRLVYKTRGSPEDLRLAVLKKCR